MKFLRSLSITQWLKNSLIFIPAVFAAVDWNLKLAVELSLAFIGFSLIASAVYINNDLADRDSDQKHPEKKKRALASGAISTKLARRLALIFMVCGLAGLFFISPKTAGYGVLYVCVNWSYSFILKTIPLLDLLCILSGYLIRLLIGQEIAYAPLSPWILGFVGLLAIYLVLMKRRGDVQLFETTGILHRKTVPFYAKMKLPLVTLILAHVLVIFFAAYIHFVFVHYSTASKLLPYATIPLTYLAIFWYHRNAQKNIQKDPIAILLRNYWSLSLLFVSFAILILNLYQNL